MNTLKRNLTAMICLSFLGAASNSALAGINDPGINKRQHRQHERIEQGVRSGQLTKEERKNLVAEQRAIRKKERLYKSDGNLSKDERKDLQKGLNAASKDIYNEKHDAEHR